MGTKRNSERIRFRYGICLNDNCEKCKSKEIQEIPARKEFVCAECGKPLRECPPPKKGGKAKLAGIIVGAVILLALIGGIIYIASKGEDAPNTNSTGTKVTTMKSDSVKTAKGSTESDTIRDSIKVKKESNEISEETVKKPLESAKPVSSPVTTPPPAPVSTPAAKTMATSGTKDLGYATFKGSWPNDVNGRMVFKTSHAIDSRDPKGRVAEAGDYVIGEFSDGHLVQGIWYGADNQVKGSVIIGK